MQRWGNKQAETSSYLLRVAEAGDSVATFMTFTNKFSDCLGCFIDSKRFTQGVNITLFDSTRSI